MQPGFDDALAFVLDWEGGGAVTDDPADPGGTTRWGISLRFYRRLHPDAEADDIRGLEESEAVALYREHFWQAQNCQDLPPPLALLVFDMGVNCPPEVTVRALQQALRVTVDGVFGPVTLAAARDRGWEEMVLRDLCAERAAYYAGLAGFARYGRGWLRRTLAAHGAALALRAASIDVWEAVVTQASARDGYR
ncbi:glycoside hydrolase family 108 protein [Fodinicurvata sediminis]|uniref:glycoside hydrolase family 108 protein n=1 Tax=Fodinicurvata sediminis TaxID=1121832 RepID=UPI0003B7B5CE|nr:glycosyl hydrolase 108 family protein [Fodinicurvata sediminis]